jgi:antitoxin (DNA-binding transcriptional repressor) of toxin-antitoxin stability system
MTSTIDAAETTLPELLNNLQAGDTVILTSGEGKTPIAKVEAIPPPVANPQRLGFLKHLNLPPIPDSAWFDPLPEDELRLWNEGDPDDPLYTLDPLKAKDEAK